MQAELQTARLQLRPVRATDAPAALAHWLQDAEVMRYLGMRTLAALADARQLLAWEEARWRKGSAWTWVLLPRAAAGLPAAGAAVGWLQLQPQPAMAGQPPHHARLGLALGRAWQGQGLMREALAAVLQAAWQQPALWRIDALCDVDNRPSQRLLQAAGLVCEGRLARAVVHPAISLQPRDAALWAVVRAAAQPDSGPKQAA